MLRHAPVHVFPTRKLSLQCRPRANYHACHNARPCRHTTAREHRVERCVDGRRRRPASAGSRIQDRSCDRRRGVRNTIRVRCDLEYRAPSILVKLGGQHVMSTARSRLGEEVSTHVDEEEVWWAPMRCFAGLYLSTKRASTGRGIGNIELIFERGGRVYSANVHDLVRNTYVLSSRLSNA